MGVPAVVGTGFEPDISAMEFGPDGALYVSGAGQIARISPQAPNPVRGDKLILRVGGRSGSRSVLISTMFSGRGFRKGNGTVDDPVRGGGALRVKSLGGDGFDTTYDLPANGWRYIGREGQGKGYRFTGHDPQLRIRATARRLQIVGVGSGFGHSLQLRPDEVWVSLNLGGQTSCAKFGGRVKYTQRKLVAAGATAPSSCAY